MLSSRSKQRRDRFTTPHTHIVNLPVYFSNFLPNARAAIGAALTILLFTPSTNRSALNNRASNQDAACRSRGVSFRGLFLL